MGDEDADVVPEGFRHHVHEPAGVFYDHSSFAHLMDQLLKREGGERETDGHTRTLMPYGSNVVMPLQLTWFANAEW